MIEKISKVLAAISLFCTLSAWQGASAAEENHPYRPATTASADDFSMRPADAAKVLKSVDDLVRNNFYNASLAKTAWTQALEQNRSSILSSTTLSQLAERINKALGALGSSHTEFVTTNDDLYYFLHSLFHGVNKLDNPKMDFTGVITGGVKKRDNQVRYVLEDSPGAKAGIRRNDIIETVDGQPYEGQRNFWHKAGKKVSLAINRDGEQLTVTLTPTLDYDYEGYVKAIGKSAKVEGTPEGKVGYLHYWAGGAKAHDAFEEAMSKSLTHTDGLILDFRDGYGANSSDDLEILEHKRATYPIFTTIDRSGKKNISQDFYDKPVVAIINGGVRSGRELLSFGLKRSKRATLVGERAGMVLAGRLFPIDNRCSLYLAVLDILLDGERLEGVGVPPDVEVVQDALSTGSDIQLEKARAILADEMRANAKNNQDEDK